MTDQETPQEHKFIASEILKTRLIKKQVKKNTNLPKFLMKTFLKCIGQFQQVYRDHPDFIKFLKRDLKKYGSHNQSRYYNINDLSSLLSHSVPKIQLVSKDQLEKINQKKLQQKNKKKGSPQGFKLYIPQGKQRENENSLREALIRFKNLCSSSTSTSPTQQYQKSNDIQQKKQEEDVLNSKNQKEQKNENQSFANDLMQDEVKQQIKQDELKAENIKIQEQQVKEEPNQKEYRCLNRKIMTKILRNAQNEILKSIYLKNTMTYLNATKIFSLRCRNNLLVRRVQSR